MLDEISSQPLINTYARLTAESILAYANVHLNEEQLSAQLAEHHSFYAGLVRVPSLIAFNSIINSQCRDIQTYSQERLIEYILSGADQKMTSEEDTALKDNIEAKRIALIKLGEMLTGIEKNHYQLMLDTYVLQEKQAAQWSEEAEQHVDRLWQEVIHCKPDVSEDWRERLLVLVKTQAAGVHIPDDILKAFKIEGEPSSTEKALLQLLIEIGAF